MPCANCNYYDENERWGSKGYCTWYKQYVYPDDRSCNHYTAANGGGCIFTSACCSYLGLPDDCDELSTLRKYRDGYMRSLQNGKELIEEYYRIAPPIVKIIDSREDRDGIYKSIYKTVEKCVSLIKADKNEEALKEYKNMVLELKEKYSVK